MLLRQRSKTEKHRNLYGRRQGKVLKPAQKGRVEQLLPTLSLNLDQIKGCKNKADLAEIFSPSALGSKESALNTGKKRFPEQEYWLEIGFGGGEHLAFQAKNNPHISFIGAEFFINGVAKLLAHIEEQDLENIRILFGDARPLLEALPPKSLSRAFILYPDPWPKNRHAARRIVNQETFNTLARLMPRGAKLLIASDHEIYQQWTLEQVLKTPYFNWNIQSPAQWRVAPEDWFSTRYEQKALRENRRPAYFQLERNDTGTDS